MIASNPEYNRFICIIRLYLNSNNIRDIDRMSSINQLIRKNDIYLNDIDFIYFLNQTKLYTSDFWKIINWHQSKNKIAGYLIFWSSIHRVSNKWYHPEINTKDVINYKLILLKDKNKEKSLRDLDKLFNLPDKLN